MSFTLEVEFTGLCLHVEHRDGSTTRNEVAVLLPDARYRGGPLDKHADGTSAVPHVGYLRVDLANVAGGIPHAHLPHGERPPDRRGLSDGPPFELLYRFGDRSDRYLGGQTLDFGLDPVDESMVVATRLPDLDEIAPGYPVRADLFTQHAGGDTAKEVRTPLLMRTLLRGGSLTVSKAGLSVDHWGIESFLNPKQPVICSNYPGEVVWTRRVDARQLMLTLTPFDGDPKKVVKLPLRPIDVKGEQIIRLKIANLCADNPLEWSELRLRGADIEDSDFKWFYQLLDPKAPSWGDVLEAHALPPAPKPGSAPTVQVARVPRRLPAPRIVTQVPERHMTDAGIDDCSGSRAALAFPPFEKWFTA